MNKLLGFIGIAVFCGILFSCSHGEIQIENNFKNAHIINVEWGGLPITDFLNSGESSLKRKIENSDYYNIKLPESYPLSFFLVTETDTSYCETKEVYTLEHGKFILISLEEKTQVNNYSKNITPI
jgi:hypothetical protein